MEKLQITRLTDGVWNSPHTISPLNGCLEPKSKAADCLSWLVEPTSPLPSVHMLTASHTDGPTFNTRSCILTTSPNTTSTLDPDVSPRISQEMNPTPKPLTGDRIETLL